MDINQPIQEIIQPHGVTPFGGVIVETTLNRKVRSGAQLLKDICNL